MSVLRKGGEIGMIITLRNKDIMPLELNKIDSLELIDSSELSKSILYAHNITSDKCYLLKSGNFIKYFDLLGFEVKIEA